MLVTHDVSAAVAVADTSLRDDLAADIRKNRAIGMRPMGKAIWSADCSDLSVAFGLSGGGGCVEVRVRSCPYPSSPPNVPGLDVTGGSMQAYVNDADTPRVTSYSIGGFAGGASTEGKDYPALVKQRARCRASGRSTR